MIVYQSATTGISTSQIIATQNASSGMWAFAEGIEVMFMVVLFYLLRPIVFNIVGRVAATRASPSHAESRTAPYVRAITPVSRAIRLRGIFPNVCFIASGVVATVCSRMILPASSKTQ
jgi:hypothetical protein